MKQAKKFLPSSSIYDNNRNLLLIAFSFLIIWLYMLGARTLVPTDEGRYAEMAREMMASGNWVTQRLNGIKYFEKPPLQNWMNAISFELFGLGDWQARLWTGLCGLIGIIATSYTALQLFGRRVAISSALVLASSFYWAGLAHINTLDMGLSGMMTLALCGLLLAQRDGATAKEQRNGMILCWTGMALATLSKGLIGFVLPGAVLVLYTIWTRDWGLWARLHIGKGLVIFFAITAPWFVLVWQQNPEHPQFFFIHEHLQRFTSTVHKRGGPWHYFIKCLIIGILPWLAIVGQSLYSGASENTGRFQAKKMLFIWAAFIFFFFSISGSKLPSYILPIFPALALLIALELEDVSTRILQASGLLLVLIGGASLGLTPYLPTITKIPFETAIYAKAIPWAMVGSAVILISGMIVLIFSKQRRDSAIFVLAIGSFLGGQALFLASDAYGRYRAGIEHVANINKVLNKDTPIFSVGQYEQSLPFYLGRTFILVEHADEMAFGLGQEPALWIEKREEFIDKWKQLSNEHTMAVAIMKPSVYKEMEIIGLPMRVIGEDPKRIIVTPY